MSLEIRSAKLGCQGCYYDTHDGCPSEEAIAHKLPAKEWPCTINGESIIWEEIDDARGETTTPQE